jgi:outer membrane protein
MILLPEDIFMMLIQESGFLLFILLITSTHIFAEKPVDLLHCFADAAQSDPTYQAQVAIFNVTKQEIPENYAALLPQVALSAAVAREFQYMTHIGRGYFHTNNVGAQANQTVFNYTQFKQLEQARFVVKAAFATLSAQQQDLMIRTSKAYLDVLEARQMLGFVEQQKKYITEQLTATQTLFDHNDAAITDLEQAKGAYSIIDSELYTAQINYYDAIQTLSQITGVRYKRFSPLNNAFHTIHPTPDNLETWLKVANEQNWNLRATRLNVSAAREALAATKGGMLPTLSASTSFSNGDVPGLFLQQTAQSNIASYGLNANWNVFQGGLTIAQIKAAVATVQQTIAEMRKQYLQTMADTRKAYNTINVGASRVESIREALASNTRALQLAQEAYRAGELTITEILQIQNQLYSAQRQYVQYTYDYLFNILLLKQAAGILSVKSLAQINTLLIHKDTP